MRTLILAMILFAASCSMEPEEIESFPEDSGAQREFGNPNPVFVGDNAGSGGEVEEEIDDTEPPVINSKRDYINSYNAAPKPLIKRPDALLELDAGDLEPDDDDDVDAGEDAPDRVIAKPCDPPCQEPMPYCKLGECVSCHVTGCVLGECDDESGSCKNKWQE